MVENQLPVSLLLDPYSRKPVLAGDSFALVLPIHCRPASLDRRVSVDAYLNFVRGDRLEFQFAGRKIGNHLRIGSHRAAWPYTDKILSIDTLRGRHIRIDLRLNALLIHLSYDSLSASSSLRAGALPQYDCGRDNAYESYINDPSHGDSPLSSFVLLWILVESGSNLHRGSDRNQRPNFIHFGVRYSDAPVRPVHLPVKTSDETILAQAMDFYVATGA
jgi:hypothetical protein